MPETPFQEWLLLAASLPGKDASTARVRLWRALKDTGAVNLRDGVTLVPASEATRARFAEFEKDVESEGGSVWIFALPPQSPAIETKLRAMFDRTAAYGELAPAAAALRKEISSIDEATARLRLRQVEREFQVIAELDFFPGAPQKRLRESLEKLHASINRRFSPEEPTNAAGGIPRRDARDFRGARWATRKRLWVDRVASAWLIKGFIDPRAKFAWLDKPADCPKDAYGFDFDGATFTHVESLVTFEVLLASFNLLDDAGLAGLARLVHYLDVGGDVIAEAAGFEAVLAGLRDSCSDDDALLKATTPVLDALYQHFSHART